jgi:hypothetical protein
MLGLKYGTVRLVAHDPRWAPAFLAERVVLAEALDGLSCQTLRISPATLYRYIALGRRTADSE